MHQNTYTNTHTNTGSKHLVTGDYNVKIWAKKSNIFDSETVLYMHNQITFLHNICLSLIFLNAKKRKG